MRAEATTTPSAGAATARACSGVETPKPMITGRSVAALSRPASTADASPSDARSPVTPMRLTP